MGKVMKLKRSVTCIRPGHEPWHHLSVVACLGKRREA